MHYQMLELLQCRIIQINLPVLRCCHDIVQHSGRDGRDVLPFAGETRHDGWDNGIGTRHGIERVGRGGSLALDLEKPECLLLYVQLLFLGGRQSCLGVGGEGGISE